LASPDRDDVPQADVPQSPDSDGEALAFARWHGQRRKENGYESDHPSDIAGELQRETAMARLAYREVDREILDNNEDQLHALLDACGTLTDAVEGLIDRLQITAGVMEGERILGRHQYWIAVEDAECGRRSRTVEELNAEAARLERREEKERERREEVTP
jgi:hypothetical protein